MNDVAIKKLNNLEKLIAKIFITMATKDDLKQFVTKKDLKEGLDSLLADIFYTVDKRVVKLEKPYD